MHGFVHKRETCQRIRIHGVLFAQALRGDSAGLLECFERVRQSAALSFRFTQSEQRAGILERGPVRGIGVNIGGLAQQLFAFFRISLVHQASVIAQRGGHQHVMRPVDFPSQFESGSIIGFRAGPVAHGLVEDGAMVQQLNVNGVGFSERTFQQRRRFVVIFFGGGVVAELHFQIGRAHQAGGVDGMLGPDGFAQDLERGGEIGFRLLVLAEAMIVAGEIHQQRSILGRGWMLGIDVGLVNGSGFFECCGRLFVFAFGAENGPECFQRLGYRGIVRAQDARSHGHGLFGERLGFGKAARVTAKKREIVGAFGIVGRIGAQFFAAQRQALAEECFAILQVAGVVIKKSEAIETAAGLLGSGRGIDGEFCGADGPSDVAFQIKLFHLPIERVPIGPLRQQHRRRQQAGEERLSHRGFVTRARFASTARRADLDVLVVKAWL